MSGRPRITEMDVRVVGSQWRNLVFVELTTDDGLVGLGEATLHNLDGAVVQCLEFVRRRYVLGADPFARRALVHTITRDLFWRGVVLYTTASAIEIACADIAAKAAGVPVYRLLGGPFRAETKAYANGWYTSQLTPESVAARARETVARGFQALKIDPFGAGELHCDERELRRVDELLRELRAAVGPDVEIMLEGHGRFDVASALRIAHRLAVHDLAWFEEPVAPEALAAQAQVAARSPIPIAAGERLYTVEEFRRALELGALHVAQPDILHVGGFGGMQDIAAVCMSAGVMVAPHNSNSLLCTVASLHAGAAVANMRVQETFDDFDPDLAELLEADIALDDGVFRLGDAPGLGVQLDHEAAERLTPISGQFNLFADEWHRRRAT